MKFILGNKGPMTTVFTEDGRAYAATIIYAAPVTISQIKTKEKDGYGAVQIAAGETKEKHVNKAQLGHLAKAMPAGRQGKAFRHFREIRLAPGAVSDVEAGASIDASVFAAGDTVEVSAISKGKGFQGVVKRHGFHGGPRSHGQKHSEREPGAIGGGGGRAGGRVAKGMRMAGRMGGDRITVKNLKVLQTLPENNGIVISGAVPGRRGTLVEIRAK